MIRTQVYLTEDIHSKVKLTALRKKKAEDQVIREALEEGLASKPTTGNAGEALLALADLGKKLDIHLGKNASAEIDNQLYFQINLIDRLA